MSTVSDSTQYSNSLQKLKDRYESELKEQRLDHQNELQKLKESHSEDVDGIKASARKEVQRLKDELYDSSGKRVARELQEKAEERQAFDRHRDQIEKEASRKSESKDRYLDQRLKESLRENQDRIGDALAAQRHSHEEEMKPIRQELALYRNEDRDVAVDRAQARQEVIDQYEGEHLMEKKNIVDSYERLVDRLHDQEDAMQYYYSEKLMDATADAEGRAERSMTQQRQEFDQVLRNQRADQNRMEEGYQEELRAMRDDHAKGTRQLTELNREEMGRALNEKDQAYQRYLQDNSKRVKSELRAREEVIRDLTSTTDPRKVSPGLIQKLMTEEELRYHEKLKMVQDSQKGHLDALRLKDHEDRLALREQFEETARLTGRELHREKDLQKRAFATTYQEMKELHEQEMRQSDGRLKQSVDRLNEKHAREVMQGQKVNRVVLQEQRDSLKEERDHAVSDLQLEQGLRDREWFLKLNEQKRDSDKKMAIERDLHERELLDQKAEFQKKLHEQERASRRILEENDRNLKQQTKQLEMVHREKERFLIEHYEEELDKMKRSNAQLIEKKS